VIYLEPYPKSYAFELHRDSIVVDPDVKNDEVCLQRLLAFRRFDTEIYLRRRAESMRVVWRKIGIMIDAGR
jgi:hypothetical protein